MLVFTSSGSSLANGGQANQNSENWSSFENGI